MFAGGHWPDIARRWGHVGPPLRPSAPDLAACVEVLQLWAALHGPPRALILGVTPELYRLPWPPGSRVSAIDRTPGMIEALWPGPRDAVLCADWTALPLPSGSCDLALCDGGVHLLRHPDDHEQLVRALHRVLAPEGACILRLFVPPERPEAPEVILDDLFAGAIASPNHLKLRLAMALQADPQTGVCLGDVWEVLHAAAPDLVGLAERVGWEVEACQAIETYRACPNRYHFVTVEQVCDLFCRRPGGFVVDRVRVPDYGLGERCPTVVLRRLG